MTDLEMIEHMLKDAYTQVGIRVWLNSRNRNLQMRRPIDLLKEGDVDGVLEEVGRITGGAS